MAIAPYRGGHKTERWHACPRLRQSLAGDERDVPWAAEHGTPSDSLLLGALLLFLLHRSLGDITEPL